MANSVKLQKGKFCCPVYSARGDGWDVLIEGGGDGFRTSVGIDFADELFDFEVHGVNSFEKALTIVNALLKDRFGEDAPEVVL